MPAAQADGPAPKRVASGWLPYWMTSPGRPVGVTSAVQNADLFTDVSPFWYSATAKSGGGVQVRLNPNFTNGAANAAWAMGQLKGAGLTVLPAIADGSGKGRMASTLADPALRAQHVADIVDLVVANGYDGIDLDYETFAFSDGSSSWARHAAELDRVRHRAGRRAACAGQAAGRHDPAAVQHRRRVRPEVRLLGLQHRRHRAGRRPHPDHGLRLPRQRHRPDRADAVGARRSSSTASPSWTRPSSRSACRPTGAPGRASTEASPASSAPARPTRARPPTARSPRWPR